MRCLALSIVASASLLAQNQQAAADFKAGRFDQAIAEYEQAGNLSAADRFTYAMALIHQGRSAQAQTQLSQLNATHPDTPIYLYWLARIEYDQRLYEAASEKFQRVIHLDPSFVRAYDNLGLCYDMRGMQKEAEAEFLKAVSLNAAQNQPSPWPPENYGILLLRMNRFQEAAAQFRAAFNYSPEFAAAHYNLGRALEKQGNDAAAIGEYQKAAAADTSYPEPLYSLGLLYKKSGNTREADAAFAEYKRRKAL